MLRRAFLSLFGGGLAAAGTLAVMPKILHAAAPELPLVVPPFDRHHSDVFPERIMYEPDYLRQGGPADWYGVNLNQITAEIADTMRDLLPGVSSPYSGRDDIMGSQFRTLEPIRLQEDIKTRIHTFDQQFVIDSYLPWCPGGVLRRDEVRYYGEALAKKCRESEIQFFGQLSLPRGVDVVSRVSINNGPTVRGLLMYDVVTNAMRMRFDVLGAR